MQLPRLGPDKRIDLNETFERLSRRAATFRARLQGRQLATASASGSLITTHLVAAALESQDRFQISGLQPVDRPRSFSLPWGQRISRPGRVTTRPMTLVDWLLLGIEAAGALVVAWLAFQYIYTTYIDTAPRRLTPPQSRPQPSNGNVGVPGASATATAEATPTFFIEVLPPLIGEAGTPSATPTFFAEVLPPLMGEPGTPSATPVEVQPTATPTIAPEALLPSRLRIPVMFLDSRVEEVKLNMGEWQVSPMDVGHHEGSGVPGQVGNVVLAGHRDINSALFRELDRLQPGDEVFVSNALGEYRYLVEESLVVSPRQVEVMDPTDDKRVTLITCTPIGLATQRLVVIAKLDEGYAASSR